MKYQHHISLFLVLCCFLCCGASTPEIAPTLTGDYTSLLCVKKNGKFGFVNEYGKEVIPCQFDFPSFFKEGLVSLKKGKNWAYYNARGEKVLDMKNRFTYCGEFHDGAAFVSSARLKKGILPNYVAFYEDLCPTLQFINKQGELLFKTGKKWDFDCYPIPKQGYSSGMLKLKKKTEDGQRIGFIDKRGELKIPFEDYPRGVSTSDFKEGLSVRKETTVISKGVFSTKMGYINQTGDWELPPIYRKVHPFNQGVAVVWESIPNEKLAYKHYLIDKSGKRVFPSGVETNNRRLRDTLVAVYKTRRNDKGREVFGSYGQYRRYALAHIDGRMITDFKFAVLEAGETPNSLWTAALPDSEDIGFIDDTGAVVIPYQYRRCKQDFQNGLAVVTLKDKEGMAVINSNGDIVLPLAGKTNYHLQGNGGVIFVTDEDGNNSFYNKDGQVINLDGYEPYGLFHLLSLKED